MSKKDFNYEKLNEILYDNNNVISYIKCKSYSLKDYEEISTYFLEDLRTVNLNLNEITYDSYVALNNINENSNLNYNLSSNETINTLVKNEFIEKTSKDIDIAKDLSSYKSSRLKALLKKHGIKAKGKRKELLKIAIENIPESEFGDVTYEITIKGKDFLAKNKWIEIYDEALTIFEFSDFYNYMNENQGDIYQLGLDFINLHIENAKRAYDFVYLDKCLNSKSIINIMNSDYENALNWELKRFILRLNPLYYSYIDQYSDDLIFNPENIDRIYSLSKELNINNLKDVFDKVWNSLDLEKPYISKEDTFNYLEMALEEDLYYLSEEFSNSYLTTEEEYFELSLFYYNHHRYLLSRDFFDFAIEENPSKSDAFFYKALSLCHIKNFEYASDIIDEALNIDSNNGQYWCVKAIINFERNNSNVAIEDFKKALELNPNDSFILNNIGVCYARSEKIDEAIKYFNKAKEDNIYSKLNLGKIYTKLGEFDKAEEYFDDESMDCLIEKGCYYLIRKDYEKAVDCFNNCIKDYYSYIPIVTLKYLALYELGHEELYEQFKSKLTKVDLKFVKSLESFLRK